MSRPAMAGAGLDDALAALDAPAGGTPSALLVGLSGGLDSTVLLHVLAHRRQSQGLRAIHVHHGLHADAQGWSEHCRRLCESLGVPLAIVHVTVDAASPLGPEGAARAARYAAFDAALSPGESLLLAHHQDDQAETVLLRLLRASGSCGLAAMRPERAFGKARLIRPLLGLPRSSLRAYAQAHGLAWCEDPSNDSDSADRNFLRLRVMPLLRERWPQADLALATSAGHLAGDAGLLAEAASRQVRELGGGEDWLPVTALLALSPGWQAQVLRAWTAAQGLPPLPGPAPAHIADEVLAAPHDRAACYRWQGAELRRWGDRLYARPHPGDGDAPGWSLAWDGRLPLPLPDGGQLGLEGGEHHDLSTAFGACHVHSRRGGERILLPGRTHSHALKDRLREHGLPPWERARWPLLSGGDGELLAAGDTFLSARFQSWCETQGTRLRWQPAGAD